MPINPNLEKKVEKLQKEVSAVKQDIRFLKGILIELDAAKSAKKDEEGMKELERMMEEL